MIKKCAWCKREFYASEGWVYRKPVCTGNSMHYFCRYNHMLAWEREEERKKLQRKTNRKTRPCYCVETGEVYPSVAEAAKIIRAEPQSVRNSCERGIRAGRYHYKFLEGPE